MADSELRSFETAGLRFLLSLPAAGTERGERPVLCHLHGLDEGPPTDLRTGVTRHGPLAPESAARARRAFIVIAPHLPARGDLWHYSAQPVLKIVREVQRDHGGDPARTYLTGFSYGADGVFDLALLAPEMWAALWPVDPTRVPKQDPGRPVWFSSGEASRHRSRRFIERLRLQPPDATVTADRIYRDAGLDHVGTATEAYADDRIYTWLLSQRRLS